MTISIIVAVAENGVIGKNNQLLWRLSADLRQFKNLTTNHIIIMGRKTFESIGKPLPNRTSIVISRQKNYKIDCGTPPDCFTANSLENALEIAKDLPKNDEIFIIGGSEIYAQSLKIADKIYLTEVKTKMEGDAFFTKLNAENWQEISRISHAADEKNEYSFDFVELLKI